MKRALAMMLLVAALATACREQPESVTGRIAGTSADVWIEHVSLEVLQGDRDSLREVVDTGPHETMELMHAAANASVPVRRAVLHTLEESHAEVVPALDMFLDTHDPDALVFVCNAIAIMGNRAEDTIPKLVELVRRTSRTPDDRVAEAAWNAITEIGPATIPHLLPLLEDESLRDRALRICGEFGFYAVMELERYDTRGNLALGQEVLRSVAEIRTGQAGLFGNLRSQREFLELRRRRLRDVVRAGGGISQELAAELEIENATIEQALERLREIMESNDPTLRRRAAQVLVRFGWMADRLVPVLVDAVESLDMHLRWSAAEVLARLGPDGAPAIPGLIRMTHLIDDSTGQRLALVALGHIGTDAAVAFPDILERLHAIEWHPSQFDDPVAIRHSAAFALSRVDPVHAPAHLVPLLDDPRWSVRQAAMITLALCGPHALPALEQVLRESPGTPRARDTACALLLMGERHGTAAMMLAGVTTDDAFVSWTREEAHSQFLRRHVTAMVP